MFQAVEDYKGYGEDCNGGEEGSYEDVKVDMKLLTASQIEETDVSVQTDSDDEGSSSLVETADISSSTLENDEESSQSNVETFSEDQPPSITLLNGDVFPIIVQTESLPIVKATVPSLTASQPPNTLQPPKPSTLLTPTSDPRVEGILADFEMEQTTKICEALEDVDNIR